MPLINELQDSDLEFKAIVIRLKLNDEYQNQIENLSKQTPSIEKKHEMTVHIRELCLCIQKLAHRHIQVATMIMTIFIVAIQWRKRTECIKNEISLYETIEKSARIFIYFSN